MQLGLSQHVRDRDAVLARRCAGDVVGGRLGNTKNYRQHVRTRRRGVVCGELMLVVLMYVALSLASILYAGIEGM